MSEETRIVLKPTRWFLLRAGAMLAMFAVFAGWFLYDWKVGYPKKNLVYGLRNTFEQAGKDFAEQSAGGALTPSSWEAYVAKQKVDLPQGKGLLPPGTEVPMAWPGILGDHGRMGSDGWFKLWLEFTAERRLPSDGPEHPAVPGKVAVDAKKLREQLVMGSICGVLALGAAFVLLRTLRRTIEIDGEALVTQDRQRVPFSMFDRLDKRKWKTKGLAFAYYDDGGNARRVRIDGLTYGGFRKEDGEPAERLMERLVANFSGELVDYVEDGDDSAGDKPAEEEPAGDA